MSSTRFGITLTAKLKHADLWKAAKAVGGQSELGRRCGVSPPEIGRWCNLSGVPPKRWSEERRNALERTLYELTGKTLDELFPPELCNATEFLQSSKSIEQTKEVDLLRLVSNPQGLLAPPADTEVIEAEFDQYRKEKIEESLKFLSYREREIIKLQYGLGLDGENFSLAEVASVFKVTKERIRQIGFKALRKLQSPLSLDILREAADEPEVEAT